MENCPSYNHCRRVLNGQLNNNYKNSLKNISEINYNVKKPYPRFEVSFIPRIQVYGQTRINQMKPIFEIDHPIIAISLKNLISNAKEKIIKKSFNEDIHDKLNYYGKVLFLSNINDNLCLKILNDLENFKYYIKNLNPDIITTFDASFYLNQPRFETIRRINQVFKANEKIRDLDIYQIALITPTHLPYFKIMLKSILDMNYKTIAVPLQGTNKARDFKFRRKILQTLQDFKMHYDFEYLLVSTTPNKDIYADCFSTESWVFPTNNNNYLKTNLKNYIFEAKAAKNQNIITKYIRRGHKIGRLQT
jgi:hypothetical protein